MIDFWHFYVGLNLFKTIKCRCILLVVSTIPHLKSGPWSSTLCLIFQSSSYQLRGRVIVECIEFLMQQASHKTRSKRQEKWDGYSLPLCIKIIDALWRSRENFHIQTLCVLGHNTRRDSEGNGYPIFNGFLVSFKLKWLPFPFLLSVFKPFKDDFEIFAKLIVWMIFHWDSWKESWFKQCLKREFF